MHTATVSQGNALAPPPPAGPVFGRDVDPAPPSLAGALRRVLNLPVDAREAEPVALLSGATIGAGMAWAMNGSALVFPGTVVGITLAAISLMVSRAAEGDSRDHQARLDFLMRYPGTRDVLENAATDRDDVREVKRLFERTRRRLDEIVSAFREHCLRRRTPFSQLMGNALGEFYLTHCALHDACVIFNETRGCYYVVAVPAEDSDRVMRLIKAPRRDGDKDAAISAIFRNAGATFMRADMVNENLSQAVSYRSEALGEEWRVSGTRLAPGRGDMQRQGAPMAASITPEPYTRARQFKRGTARPLPGSRSAAELKACRPPAALNVIRGVTLAEQWRLLPRNGVTQGHIRTISDDLRMRRVHGHPVQVGTLKCTASDLNMDGLAGRGRWRLLHRRTAEGIELIGIADYHESRTPLVWWTG